LRDVKEVLDEKTRRVITNNSDNRYSPTELCADCQSDITVLGIKSPVRKTRITKHGALKEIFGGTLLLKHGDINDLYSDITKLNQFYLKSPKELSKSFPAIIRMSLRLLCESAAKDGDKDQSIDNYIIKNFEKAKSNLEQDIRTLLSELNINQKTLPQLLLVLMVRHVFYNAQAVHYMAAYSPARSFAGRIRRYIPESKKRGLDFSTQV
jgi:hypothetical protein